MGSTAHREGLPWGSARDGLPVHDATPAGWSATALADLDALLLDHAHCERKAAAAARKLRQRVPEDAEITRAMTALEEEEKRHLQAVEERIRARGRQPGRPQHDRYVQALRRHAFQRAGGPDSLVDLLLVDALIEARSCERMRLLVEGLDRGEGRMLPQERRELRAFYLGLAAAEARHWERFRDLAERRAPRSAVARRLAQLAEAEAEIVRTLPPAPRMH